MRLFLSISIFLFSLAQAAEYYVSPTGLATNPGTEAQPWSLSKANTSLSPGDTAILLGGTYSEVPILPSRSGTAGNPIVYKAANKHQSLFQNINEVDGSRGPAAIVVNQRSYITIDGIKTDGVKRFLMGVKAGHITLVNNHFSNGSGWINTRFEENGDGIRIIDNYFDGGTDLLQIDGGKNHLVQGNFFGDASHTGLVLLGVQNSVVRKNKLTNRLWRNMEVESRRKQPYRLSEYNLIEENTFGFTPTAAIQYAGNRSILRGNIFRHNLTGLSWSNYLGRDKTPEAWHDEQNRFYNNVIAESGTNNIILQIIDDNKSNGIKVEESVSNSGYGMLFTTNLFNPPVSGYDDVAYGDNVVVNNIFYKNGNVKESKSSNSTQIAFDWNATPEYGRFFNNTIFSGSEGSDVFFFMDASYLDPPETRNRSVNSFQARYPDWALNNLDADPLFDDPDAGSFYLKAGSPCIDAGGFLTHTDTSGTGTDIYVNDALYFTNGYGVVEADTIRVGDEKAAVLKVDYENNMISVDRTISYLKDVSVTLDFVGSAPDIGAYEFGMKVSGLQEEKKYPKSFNLYQNYPNPFNPTTVFGFFLEKKSTALLTVFNSLGQEVEEIINKELNAGEYKFSWDARHLSSGVYLYRLTVDGFAEHKKLILLR